MELIETTYDGFLVFEKYTIKNKRTYYITVSNRHDEFLGNILWETGWRCYTFHPAKDTTYDIKCLTVITSYLEELINQRRVKKWTMKSYLQ